MQTSAPCASTTGSRNYQPAPLQIYKLLLNPAFKKNGYVMLDGLYEAHLPAGLQGQTVPALTERRHGAVWKYCVVEEVVVLLQYYTLSILTQLSLTFNIRAI